MRRNFPIYFPMYHAVALQFAQLLGQHALRGFRNQASKLSKTKCVVPKVIEDGNLVFSADNIQRGVDRGIVAGFGVFSPAFRSSISVEALRTRPAKKSVSDNPDD